MELAQILASPNPRWDPIPFLYCVILYQITKILPRRIESIDPRMSESIPISMNYFKDNWVSSGKKSYSVCVARCWLAHMRELKSDKIKKSRIIIVYSWSEIVC